ncbi:MAG TPA: hypothetical protein VFB58_18190 [Chloroflexota bacterium]|nr:hypothetical protein [Chloroflexota bacterium]
MRYLIAVTVVGSLILGVLSMPAHAEAVPPPPPPAPGCKSCPGPPPPPTPVPTLAPPIVAQKVDIAVHFSPARVHRGQTATLRVTAKAGDKVTVILRYHAGAPQTVRSRVGTQGVLQRKWRVPGTAPLGSGTVRVSVADSGKVYSTGVQFMVVR